MKFYIPEIGTRMRLTADWSFKLFKEHRNDTMLELYGFEKSVYIKQNEHVMQTLPAGTLLTVARLYIRNGMSGFSSITFNVAANKKAKRKACRFWVKLEDANLIEYEASEEDQPWWFGIVTRLRAGETVLAYPEDRDLGLAVKLKTGIKLFPRKEETKEELKAKPLLVMADGLKLKLLCPIEESGPARSYRTDYISCRKPGPKKGIYKDVELTDIVGFADLLPTSPLELLAAEAQ